MTVTEVQEIERLLGLALPRHYVEMVVNYPSALLGTEAEDFGLLNTPEAVVEQNTEVRNGPFYGAKWPDRYLVIGENGCGDLYVTKLDATEFSVGFFDHEQRAFVPHSSTKEEFVAKLLHEQGDASA